MSSKKKRDRMTRKLGQSTTPRKGSNPPPSGPQKIPISEASFLRFRVSKLNEEILKLQDQKLIADEEVVRVTKENVGLRRRLDAIETQKMYNEVGIVGGDQVLPDGKGGGVIVRLSKRAPPQVPPAAGESSMEIVKEEEEEGDEDDPEDEETPEE